MAQANDIEDVLSSIRRLVSGDPAAGTSSRETPPEAAALVLEPANRVTEPEDPFQTVQLLDQTEGADTEARTDQRPTASDSAAGIFDMDVPLAEETVATAFEEGSIASTEAATSQPGEHATAFSLQSDEEIVDLAQEERDGRDAAHVLADMDRETAAITFDLADGEDDPLVWPVPGTTHTEPEAYLEDTDYVATADEAASFTVPETLTGPGASAQRDGEAAKTTGSVTPDSAMAPMAVEQVNEISEDKADEIDLADIGDGSATDIVPLDDEAFRDLIADIVRQELAGDLGERITRNVRKLVRREIRQLLSSDEFD